MSIKNQSDVHSRMLEVVECVYSFDNPQLPLQLLREGGGEKEIRQASHAIKCQSTTLTLQISQYTMDDLKIKLLVRRS